MRSGVVVAVMLAMVLTLAVPAIADEDRKDKRLENRLERLDDRFFIVDGLERFYDFDGGVEQSNEQETESGDVEQSFNVTGGGENSNQCANVTGNVNTGNLQTQDGLVQFDSEIEEIEQEDIGSDLTVGGDSTVTCDQQVNQAAAAG
jgi:hypothetical protein